MTAIFLWTFVSSDALSSAWHKIYRHMQQDALAGVSHLLDLYFITLLGIRDKVRGQGQP